MTTFTGSFGYGPTAGVSASGMITLNLDVDVAAGARTGRILDHVTGSGTISNYALNVAGKSGFPHKGGASFSIADIGNFAPDINSGSLGISGDSVRFDGNPLAINPNVTFAQASAASNGLNPDGTAITGAVTIGVTGISGLITAPLARPLTGPAVPTLYNLAEMLSYIDGSVATRPAGWTFTDASSGDYKAAVVNNSDHSQIVIAVAGQANSGNLFADLSLFPEFGLNDVFRHYVTSTSELLAEVRAAYPGAHITLTGHSLGGSLVQLIGNASHYSTVAFDAPGAMQFDAALQAEMESAQLLGEANNNWEGNVDIRVVGDGYSLINKGDTINLMTIKSDPLRRPNPDDESHIYVNHFLDVVLKELSEPGATLDNGATETNPDVQLFAKSTLITIEESFRQVAVEWLSHKSFTLDQLKHWVDPSSATQLVFQETADSPAVVAINFLVDPNIASYKVWTQVNGTWSTPQTVAAGTTASLSGGAHAIKIEGFSSSGQVVHLPDGFLFGATFASLGQVNAYVHSINFDDFNGVNVQTPAAGQTTLTVSSSFNYTDAGNNALTVNGTASGNDTILLGSGAKTVNLGSGNDFVMVKAGATGNIVIHGGSGGETILAGAANVTLIAGLGNILFIGGDDANANVGVNTIDYSASGAVNVNLSSGIIQTSNGAINTLVNVENVTGSSLGDQITGDSHANRLAGGHGVDTLTGGGGDDRFVFALGDGTDTVTDFAAGIHTDDRVDLTAFHATFVNALAHASQSGVNTVFNFGGGDTLTLQNVVKTGLSAEDFAGLKVTRSDFSANGDSDILWARDNGTVSIWDDGQIGNAHIVANAGAFANSWHIAGRGDFDGNGHNDVLWRNDNGSVSIWDNGQIGGAHIIADAGVVAGSWHISGTGDFDGNGQSDILWRNDNGAVSIWDSGQIGGAHIIADAGVVPNSWHIAGTGDFDGNGHDDILWRNDNGAASIWDNGAIGGAHIIANAGVVPNSWHIAGTGDFDLDGLSDILWRNDNGAVSVWDTGAIGNARIVANAGVVANSWHISGIGDFDGNGHDDILWRNDNGAVSIWDNGRIDIAHIIANPGVVPNDWHIV